MLYEYNCKKCENRFHVEMSMHDTTPTYPCPKCNEEAGKVMQTPAIHGLREGPKTMYNEK